MFLPSRDRQGALFGVLQKTGEPLSDERGPEREFHEAPKGITIETDRDERAFTDHLRDPLKRDPFIPFRIVMSGGWSCDGMHPETAVLMKREIFIAFPDGERRALLPVLHIASGEAIENGARKTGPG